MSLECEAEDVPASSPDVFRKPLRSESLREREVGLLAHIAVVFREQAPRSGRRIVARSAQLDAGGTIVEPFIAPEKKRRERAAERKRVGKIVGRRETTVDTYSKSVASIGSRQTQLTGGSRVGCPDARQSSCRVAAAQTLTNRKSCGESLDSIVPREREAIREYRLLRYESRLRAQRQRFGDECITLRYAENLFTFVVDRFRQFRRHCQLRRVAGYLSDDRKRSFEPRGSSRPAVRQVLARLASPLSAESARGRILSRIDCRDLRKRRQASVYTRVLEALLELEGDVHESGLRRAFQALQPRHPEPPFVKPVLDRDRVYFRRQRRRQRLYPFRRLVVVIM